MLEDDPYFKNKIEILLKYKEYVNMFILLGDNMITINDQGVQEYIAQSNVLTACYLFKQKYVEFDVLSNNVELLTKSKDSLDLIEYISFVFTFLKMEYFGPLYNEYHDTFETKFGRLKSKVEISIFQECNNFYEK